MTTQLTVPTANGKPIGLKAFRELHPEVSGGEARRMVRSAWVTHSRCAATTGAAELATAAERGHKVNRRKSKCGAVSYSISAKPMAQTKHGAAAARIAELEAKLAAALAALPKA